MKTKAKALAQAVSVSLLIGASGCIAEPVEEGYGDELDEVGQVSDELTAVGWLCTWECKIDITVMEEESGCATGLHGKQSDAISSIEGDADSCDSGHTVASVACSVNAICTSAATS